MPSAPRALFVTDLDGTLLDSTKEIPELNRAAIARATAAGVQVAIVTGRRRSGIEREYEKLAGLDFRVATSNGSVVLAPDNLWAEWVQGLDWSVAHGLAGGDEAADADILCVTAPARSSEQDDGEPDCVVLDRERRWWTGRSVWVRDELEPADAKRITAKTLVHLAVRVATRRRAHELEEVLRAILPEEVSTHVVTAPVGSGALTEIVPTGGKGLAVRYLATQLGIAGAATAAVGDELNDCDLLDAATHRYTVGGSVLAKTRTDATEVAAAEDGAVADALDWFLTTLG